MTNYNTPDDLPEHLRDQAWAQWRNPAHTAIVQNGKPVASQPREIQPQAHESRSKLEIAMQGVINTALSQFPGMAQPDTEYRFHDTRQWRFDFAWPDYCLAVEVEGGQWINGRHQRGKGFEDDCEKYNEAALDGWMVFRFTGDMVKDGRALEMLLRCLRFYEAGNGR
jgi:hypothetical protein